MAKIVSYFLAKLGYYCPQIRPEIRKSARIRIILICQNLKSADSDNAGFHGLKSADLRILTDFEIRNPRIRISVFWPILTPDFGFSDIRGLSGTPLVPDRTLSSASNGSTNHIQNAQKSTHRTV